MRNRQAEPITRHCMNTRCRKCRARRPLVPAQGVAFPQQPSPQPSRKEVISDECINPARRTAGIAVYLAWRFMGLRIWQAILCLIFGFLLAATTAAPEIHNLIIGLVQWLT